MKIVLDTSVVLDVLAERRPFLADSLASMKKAISEGHHLYISASAATDIFYILRKALSSRSEALAAMKRLVRIVGIAQVNENCIIDALKSSLDDLEDAVVDEAAAGMGADLIITRNIKDFQSARTRSVTPEEYIRSF